MCILHSYWYTKSSAQELICPWLHTVFFEVCKHEYNAWFATENERKSKLIPWWEGRQLCRLRTSVEEMILLSVLLKNCFGVRRSFLTRKAHLKTALGNLKGVPCIFLRIRSTSLQSRSVKNSRRVSKWFVKPNLKIELSCAVHNFVELFE